MAALTHAELRKILSLLHSGAGQESAIFGSQHRIRRKICVVSSSCCTKGRAKIRRDSEDGLVR